MESKHNGIMQNACILTEADTITRPSRRGDEGAPTVIVVEKRPHMRDLLSRSLARTAGFEVLATATVDECIRSCKDTRRYSHSQHLRRRPREAAS